MPHLSLLCFCPRDLGCCGGGVDGAGVPCGLGAESVLFGVGEGLAYPAGRVPVAGDDGAGSVACGFGVGAGGEPVPGGGWGQCLQVGDGDHEPVGWVEDRGHWPSPSSAASRRLGPVWPVAAAASCLMRASMASCARGSCCCHSRSWSMSVEAATMAGVNAGACAGCWGVSSSGLTVCGSRLPRVTVRAIFFGLSMWDRWLILIPPTCSPANLTVGSP